MLKATERAYLATKIRREIARKGLQEFCRYIDPNAAEEYGADHIRLICESLEAVERGEKPRLYVAAPPSHWKSSTVSEKFPLWYLARNPTHSIIIASHQAKLSETFSRSVRENIEGNPYVRELFPDIQISNVSSGVGDWMIMGAFRSSMRAVGVGGGLAGSRGHLIIIDDPIADVGVAYSDTARKAIILWYRETLRDRLAPGGKIVAVMSRWHERDLAGFLMTSSKDGEGEQWEELRLPATDEQFSFALWPQKWPIEALKQIALAQGKRAFTARYLCSPRPDGGNMLNHEGLVMVNAEDLPVMVRKIRHWDLAFAKKKNSDYVCGLLMGEDKTGRRYLLHMKHRQGLGWPGTRPLIIETAIEEGSGVEISIEANGTQLGYYQDIKDERRMQGFKVSPSVPKIDKVARADIWGSRIQDGIICCVRAPWNGELFDQMDYFPNSDHDDIIDSISASWMLMVEGAGSGHVSVVENRRSSRGAGFPSRRGVM